MAIYIYKPHEHIQTTESAVWTIVHRLKRWTTITIYDEAGNEIDADRAILDVNTVKLYFFQKGQPKPMKGRAVLG
jgi:hypothetical protein